MRILHTSDWHIGRTLHKVSMLDAQRAALSQIAGIAAQERVDLIVVSGDVFDHAVPSADALEIRGFAGRLPALGPFSVSPGDVAVTAAAVLSVAVAAAARVPWNR